MGTNEYYRNYYYNNIKSFRQYTKKYYDLKKQDNTFNQKRALYLKNYYSQNREYLKAYMKIYYYENKKNILDKQKLYRDLNREKIKEYHKGRYLRHDRPTNNILMNKVNDKFIIHFD